MGCSGSRDQTKNTSQTKVIAIVGGPGCGKGTQCKRMVDAHKLVHISTGDLLREKKKTNPQFAKEMESGKLVNSDIVVKLVKEAFAKDKNATYLLDGFPRNQENLDVWKKIIGNSAKIEFMLFLQTSDEVMMQRMSKRAAEAETKRADDASDETQKNRIQVFKNETLPIVEKFKQENKCHVINGDMDVDHVTSEINAALKERKVGNHAWKFVEIFTDEFEQTCLFKI